MRPPGAGLQANGLPDAAGQRLFSDSKRLSFCWVEPCGALLALESAKGPQLAIARMSARDSVCFSLLAFSLAACTCLTEPGSGPPQQVEQRVAQAPAPAPPPPAPTPAPPPSAPAPEEQVGAAHVLIAYKGALRAAPTITRSKDDAQKLANKIQAQAKSGADFGALAEKYSDDPSAKARKGSLGKFGRTTMVKPFADAAFALKPGEISSVVETPFGFHVIKRTE